MKIVSVLSLLLLPMAVEAQFSYITNGNTLSIQYYDGSGGAVVISNSVGGYAVTGIGGDAFYDATSMTSVSIPSTITNIGLYAFYYCTGLTNITVDSSNPDYSSLNGVLFDKGQDLLIQYPLGLTNSSYAIPDTVTNAQQDAFAACTSLANITVPTSFTSIGEQAFYGCSSLTNIAIPDSVTSIGQAAFSTCTDLRFVVLPSSVTNIGEDAFVMCTNLGGISLDDALTGIAEDAFYECYSLTNITIPDSVTSIAEGAFYDLPKLTNFTVDGGNPAYSSLNGVLFDKAQDMLIEYPGGLTNGSYEIPNSVINIGPESFDNVYLTSVNIPNGVTNISAYAFQNCVMLSGIAVPNSVVNIGNYAFYYCTNLSSAILGNGVTRIGQYAFYDCINLASVNIPDHVVNIGLAAFGSCNGLTNIILPNSVTNIGDYAFENCKNLKAAYFEGNAPPSDGTAFSYDNITIVYYLPGTKGWGSSFGGVPTALWYLSNPQILSGEPTFGVLSNQFGFTTSWATNASVVVQAATNLANPVWVAIATNTLTNGTFYFSDSNWTSYRERFYRLSAP